MVPLNPDVFNEDGPGTSEAESTHGHGQPVRQHQGLRDKTFRRKSARSQFRTDQEENHEKKGGFLKGEIPFNMGRLKLN